MHLSKNRQAIVNSCHARLKIENEEKLYAVVDNFNFILKADFIMG